MKALDALLTKLASDEERERFAKPCFQRCMDLLDSFTINEEDTIDPETAKHIFDAGYTAAHARMSLLVEIIRVQNKALKRVFEQTADISSKAWREQIQQIDAVGATCEACAIANDALAKLEAMAKEQT